VARKSGVRKGSRGGDVTVVGSGVMANIIDRAFENPATSGGLMVMALTATAIMSNAMFLQSGRHSDFLFNPQPAPLAAHSVPAPVPLPRVRADQPAAFVPPLPHLAPRAEPDPAPAPVVALAPAPAAVVAPAADQTTLITDVQRELARLGLYAGAIDGLAGSRTSAAISAYETAAGRTPTGVATPDLLAAMKAPLPVRNLPAAVAPPAADPTAAELDQRERDRAAKIAAAQRAQAAAQMLANVRIVQGALNRIGYGPVPVDGATSAETTDAIRRFELDNGLPVTGEPSDRLIGRLISIGAVKAT
jgi:peptidoglycan hydrolase-like protein with peptidoglycan-binding domain